MKRSTIIILALLLAACAKESLQSTYDKQTSNIESFITASMNRDPHATLVRNDGAYRLNFHDTLDATLHRTDSLDWGGQVVLYYACYTLTSTSLSNSNLIATNYKRLAEQAGWKLTDQSLYKLDTLTLDKSLLPGLAAGLVGVQPQDEGYILFTGKYGYGGSQKGTIPARSALAYYFWIENISNEN
jgi:hypothetical protein